MNKVQDSSDCCINSKFSSAKSGYFEDEYLSFFTRKLHRRSPIINRGYYIRFQAIEKIFQCWCSVMNSCSYKKCQIISLGAGYDSSYFRLKNNNKLPSGCHYVEIDFPEVMKRKYELIKDIVCSNELNPKETLPSVVLSTEEYSMVGVDLTVIPALEKSFASIGIDYDIPSLFLSECSIIYIDSKDSDTFISWVQNHFLHSAFVSYEQVYPFDAFGLIMKNHFSQVQCPLKSITKYPDEESHRNRYKKLGWSECCVFNMYDFFLSFTSEEKLRVQQLEMFDEYEMWHEKCLHYILICAAQGILSKSFLSLQPKNIIHNTNSEKILNWKCSPAVEAVQRFGHQVVSFSPHAVIISGGFGRVGKKHQRLGDIILYHTKLKKCVSISVENNKHILGKRMFHTMTKLSDETIVIIGGRSSPREVFGNVLILKESNFKDLAEDNFPDNFNCPSFDTSNLFMPVPTWRHSASLINIEGVECIFIFGGCSQDSLATNNCFILDTKSLKWSSVDFQGNVPSPRHSHSATTYKENCVIISGGLTQDEIILSSFYMFSCESMQWKMMKINGILPRYSHTSHIWKDYLFLVGGITNTANYKIGVGVVNLKTLQAYEVALPNQDPEFPILLSNHSSYIQEDDIHIVGGGGNCFSFGTHFNEKNVSFNVKDLIL